MSGCRQTVLETVVPSSVRLDMWARAWIEAGFYLQTRWKKKEALSHFHLVPSKCPCARRWTPLTARLEPHDGQLLYRAASRCGCTYLCNCNPPRSILWIFPGNQLELANRGWNEGLMWEIIGAKGKGWYLDLVKLTVHRPPVCASHVLQLHSIHRAEQPIFWKIISECCLTKLVACLCNTNVMVTH